MLRKMHPGNETEDLHDHYRLGGDLSLTQQSRIADLVKHSRLKRWLKSANSELLFIHGNGPEGEHSLEAPLSYFDAKLIFSLMQAAPVITLFHFCGAVHPPLQFDSAANLMHQLLGQLLRQEKFNINPDVSEAELALIENYDLKTTTMVFARLLRLLPQGWAVVCVLDDISMIEIGDLYLDTIKAVKNLSRLTSEEMDVAFKVLITCSIESEYLKQYLVQNRQVILLEEELVDDDGQGYGEGALDEDLAL